MKKIILLLLLLLLPVCSIAKPNEASKPSANSIQIIWPYNIQGTWAFDDATKGLKREPFVGAINDMIDNMVTNVPNAKIGFRLLFSSGFIPDHDLMIKWRRKDTKGNWYWCEKYKVEGWLCPALLKYFKSPPKEIYVKAEPLPQAVIDMWKKKKRQW